VAYLMFDLPTGRLWCNSPQQTAYPPFTSDDLMAVRWREQAVNPIVREGVKPE